MAKIIKPAVTVSKRGKVGLRGPFVRLGGVNLSRSGASVTQKVGAGSFNTRTGLRYPLVKLWPGLLALAAGIAACCTVGGLAALVIGSSATPTPQTRFVEATPTWTTTAWPTQTELPSQTPQPTQTEIWATGEPPVCDCSGDLYNCGDFAGLGISGQACFDYCRALGLGDVHNLDRDEDGSVCEGG